MSKFILPCIVSILTASVLSFGITYAFFSGKKENNIAVTSGNIDFTANFGTTTLYSALAENYYDENADTVEMNGTSIVSNEYAGFNYYNKKLSGSTFTNGGTVLFSGNTVSFKNITRGDKIKSSIVFDNNSNVIVKYRVIIECCSDDSSLYQNLAFNVGTKSLSNIKKSYTSRKTLDIGETPDSLYFDIQLPMNVSSDVENKETSIKFSVEAVQNNLYVVDGVDEYFGPTLATAPTAISNLAYIGTPIELISPGFAIGGTLKYKIDGGEYSTSIPTATNAGDYTVYYKVFGDGLHSDTTEKSLIVTINKSTSSCNAPTANTLTYNGSNQNLISAGSSSDGTINYSLDGIVYTSEIPQGKNAGDYTVYYKVIGDTNHKDTTAETINVTISKANYDMSSAYWNYSSAFTYDGSEKTILINGLPSGVTATYTNNAKTNVGDYVAHADLSYDSMNYNAPTIADKSWAISKANSTVVAPVAKTGLVYTGNSQELITAGSATGGILEYSLDNLLYSSTIPQATDAGNYVVYYKVAGDTNHNDISSSSINVSIAKANSVLSTAPTAKALNYTGAAQDLVTAGSATGGTLKYKLGEDGTYSETIPQATASGTYKVYYMVEETTNYYGIAEAFITSTIASSKQSQTAPSAPTVASFSDTSITLNAATGGKTDAEYAVSTTTTAPSTGWQASTTFSSLTPGTKYYFFAKFKESSDYFESVSDGVYLGMGYTVTIAFDVSQMSPDDTVDSSLFLCHPDETSIEVYPEAEGIEGFHIVGDDTLYFTKSFYNIISIKGKEGNYISFTTSSGAKTFEFKDSPTQTYELVGNTTVTSSKTAQCIDENSLITMADGNTKAMKDINVGDMVLSIDYDTMTLVGREVIYTSNTEEYYDRWIVPCYYLHTFSDGTIIKRAMRHRFYCLESESYKHISTWENGLHGYKLDGTNPSLVSTEVIQGSLHYARITLAGSNNYFANGLSTGDSECLPSGKKVVLNSKLELSVI